MNGANFTVNEGYSIITNKEYKDLIETSFYQEEIIHENEKLKKQLKDYQFQILESKINIFSLRNGKPESVIDVTSSWFPFDREFLEKTDIPLKDIIEFVKHKKEEQYRRIEARKRKIMNKLHYPDKPTKMQGYTKYAVLLLDFMVDEEKLENCTYGELMNPNGKNFPFDINRINQYGIDMDFCIDYIVHRKNMIVARNEDNSLTDDEIDELLEEIDEVENGKEE